MNAKQLFDIACLARERRRAPAGESFSAVERRALNTLLNIGPAALRNHRRQATSRRQC